MTIEKDLASRLAAKVSADYAKGDFAYAPNYYLRKVCLDLLRELAIATTEVQPR